MWTDRASGPGGWGACFARAPSLPPARVEPWRLVCLISLGVFIALGLAAYAIGALPGDQFLLRVLGAKDAGFSTDLARWVNHAGRAEVLVPGTIILFWLSALARRRWWLWCGVLVGAPL